MCSTKLSGTDVPSKDNPHLVILSTNMGDSGLPYERVEPGSLVLDCTGEFEAKLE